MKFENLIFAIRERPPAYKTEVGDILLVLQAPNGFPLPARIRFERNAADVLLFRSTSLEARIASAKNSAKHAITWGRHPGTSRPEAETMAIVQDCWARARVSERVPCIRFIFLRQPHVCLGCVLVMNKTYSTFSDLRQTATTFSLSFLSCCIRNIRQNTRVKVFTSRKIGVGSWCKNRSITRKSRGPISGWNYPLRLNLSRSTPSSAGFLLLSIAGSEMASFPSARLRFG